MKFFRFNGLLQRGGWVQGAYVGVDYAGTITSINEALPVGQVPIETVNGYAVPGFQNAHSHAFQYAMAGLAEKHAAGSNDDFWSWREAMYTCALSIGPEQVESIAGMLYAEMLLNGYTHVAEFHYLHHDLEGNPYSNRAEIGERLVAAAATAGIKITLVPVFYQKGNFGKEPSARQRRFICTTIDEYFQLLDASENAVKNYNGAQLGYGVHSMRAVGHDDVIRTFQNGSPLLPFHLHAAEQLKEVSDCEDFLGKRPVEWLLDNLPLSDRCHLVHCTHLSDSEVLSLARSAANVVLCPGTEANLGDGIFRLGDFARSGGHWSLGTDSHISLQPLEDLRWMDYTQRLITHKRNTFDEGAISLITEVLVNGRKAMKTHAQANFFEVGTRFDAVVYDAHMPLLSRDDPRALLSTIVYTGDRSVMLGTIVNGNWIIKRGEHIRREPIFARYGAAIRAIAKQVN
ncbi:MAG TPA: formimidoylglutamate deiminase [Chryseolinea sp.]|nr:formimidoylglutamate deiminase [Chryseolinea sp.]